MMYVFHTSYGLPGGDGFLQLVTMEMIKTSCSCYLWLTHKIADANIRKDATKTYSVVTNTQKKLQKYRISSK